MLASCSTHVPERKIYDKTSGNTRTVYVEGHEEHSEERGYPKDSCNLMATVNETDNSRMNFVYLDIYNKTNIKDGDFSNDKLETIIIATINYNFSRDFAFRELLADDIKYKSYAKITYTSDQIDTTQKGMEIAKLFDTHNKIYNETRKKIMEETEKR